MIIGLTFTQKKRDVEFQSRFELKRNIAVGAIGGAAETALQMPTITYKFCSQEGRLFPRAFSGWYREVLI